MDDQASYFYTTLQSAGPSCNWFICITNQCPIATLFFMAARPSCWGHWCFHPGLGQKLILCLSSLQRNPQNAAEATGRQCEGDSDTPTVADAGLVPGSSSDDNSATYRPPQTLPDPATRPDASTSPSGKFPQASCHAVIQNSFRAAGLSNDVITILTKSRRDSTNAQYQTYLERWVQFCSEEKINTFSPHIKHVLNIYVCNIPRD